VYKLVNKITREPIDDITSPTLVYHHKIKRGIAEWEEVQVSASTFDDIMSNIRAERNRLLASCDWTQLSDVLLSPEQKNAWYVYRQALRDLPENITDINNPVWPIAPTQKVD
jgi:L-amino acid N-acyltransferase YncA